MKKTMISVRRPTRREVRPTLKRCDDHISLGAAFD
jgi:hypothetical protein